MEKWVKEGRVVRSKGTLRGRERARRRFRKARAPSRRLYISFAVKWCACWKSSRLNKSEWRRWRMCGVVGVIVRSESGDTIVVSRYWEGREEHVVRVWCGVECWPRRRELSQRDAQGGIQRANGLAVTVVPLIYSRIFSRMFTPHSAARTTLLSASPSARHSIRAGPACQLLVVLRGQQRGSGVGMQNRATAHE